MKKLLSLTIALLLVFSLFPAPACAEAAEIDLSGYSLEELIELFLVVRDELSGRLDLADNSSLIGRSVYTVGTDIKAGRYVLTVYETDIYEWSDGSRTVDNSISLYGPEIDGDREQLMWFTDLPVGEHFVVSLTDGELFKLYGCLCIIEASNAFWAP